MTVNEYQQLAMSTLNPALCRKEVLINSVMGLCGESGEAIDLVKKWLAQGHELDKAAGARAGRCCLVSCRGSYGTGDSSGIYIPGES